MAEVVKCVCGSTKTTVQHGCSESVFDCDGQCAYRDQNVHWLVRLFERAGAHPDCPHYLKRVWCAKCGALL
jgi:hypothetical protein